MLLHVEVEASVRRLFLICDHLPKLDCHFAWYQQRLLKLGGDVDWRCDDSNPFVLFYFSQADRQHPDTWCSLQSVSKQPGWQIEELIVREGPDTLQAGTPGNSDLNLLHIFWHRLIYLALIFFLD